MAATQLRRNLVGQTRRAVIVAEYALDDERKAERQQQAVQMVELIEPLQEEPLDHHADDPDHDGRHEQGEPIIEADQLQQQERHEGAHHVLGTMGEIDDVEHAEDDGKPQAQ